MNKNALLLFLFLACVAVSSFGGGYVVDGGGGVGIIGDTIDGKNIINSDINATNKIDAGAITTGTINDARIPAGIARDSEIPGNGSFTFSGLSDVPSRVGQALKVFRVNPTATGYEWVSMPTVITSHSALAGLDFESSGHTGFASAGHLHHGVYAPIASIPGNASFSFGLLNDVATRTGNASKVWRVKPDETGYEWGTVTGGVTSHSALTGLDFDSSGHIGFASAGHLHHGVYAPISSIPNNASFSFGFLNDVATRTNKAGFIWRVKLDGSGYEWAMPATGTLASVSFLDLTDTPTSYVSHQGKYVAVSLGETHLYFASGVAALPDITGRNGAVLRVNDAGTDIEWWEARDYAASFSTFVVTLATNSTVVISNVITPLPSRGDVILIENGSNWQGDYIAFGPAASTAAQLRTAGHRLNKMERFTARVATTTFNLALCSAHDRIGTGVISVFWGAK